MIATKLRQLFTTCWLLAAVKVSGLKSILRKLEPCSISSTLGGKASRYSKADADQWADDLRSKYGIPLPLTNEPNDEIWTETFGDMEIYK